MAEQASEDLFSTLMDISDTIREKALTLSENEEPKGIRVGGDIMRQHLLWETYLDYCSFAHKRCPLITRKNFLKLI